MLKLFADFLADAVRPPRDLSRTPLFQVNFRAPNQPYPCLQLNGITASPAQYLDNGTAKFDLALELESATGRACYFEYATDLFKEATIVQMETDLLHALNVQLFELSMWQAMTGNCIAPLQRVDAPQS